MIKRYFDTFIDAIGYVIIKASPVIAAFPAAITILEGPQAADDLRWWRIRYDNPAGSAEGWVAESTASGVQILGAD